MSPDQNRQTIDQLERDNASLRAVLKIAAVMRVIDLLDPASQFREAIDGYTRGAFTGWIGKCGPSQITLDAAKEHFSLCMADLMDSFDQTANEFMGKRPAATPQVTRESLVSSTFDAIERDMEKAGCLVMTDEGFEAFKEIVTGHLSRMTDLVYNLYGNQTKATTMNSEMNAKTPEELDPFRSALEQLVEATIPVLINGHLKAVLGDHHANALNSAMDNANKLLAADKVQPAAASDDDEDLGDEIGTEDVVEDFDAIGDFEDIHDYMKREAARRKELLTIFKVIPPM